MELKSILVYFTLFLMTPKAISKLNKYSDPRFSLWTLTVRHQVLSMDEHGILSTVTTMPTLYSVFRSELYADESEPSNSPEFSLVGIAAGYRICMDKRGLVYTKKLSKKEKKWVKSKKELKNKADKNFMDPALLEDVGEDEDLKDESPIPSEQCLFKSYIFDDKESYHHRTAIYSAIPFRNYTNVGQFLAFLKNGHTKRYRRPLNKVRLQKSIAIYFDPIRKASSSSISTRSRTLISNMAGTNKKMDNILSQTTFNHCNGRAGRKMFNIKVRNCIRNSTKSLNINRLNHSNLAKIIQKCQCPLGKICRQNVCMTIGAILKDVSKAKPEQKMLENATGETSTKTSANTTFTATPKQFNPFV